MHDHVNVKYADNARFL